MSDALKWAKQQVHSEVEVGKVFKDKWLLRTSRDTLVARVVNNRERVKQVPVEFETSKLPRRNHGSILWPTQGVQTSEKVTYSTRTKRWSICLLFFLWVMFVYPLPPLLKKTLTLKCIAITWCLLVCSNCHNKDFPAGEGPIYTFTLINI